MDYLIKLKIRKEEKNRNVWSKRERRKEESCTKDTQKIVLLPKLSNLRQRHKVGGISLKRLCADGCFFFFLNKYKKSREVCPCKINFKVSGSHQRRGFESCHKYIS